jgi:hypothetical protein
MRNFLKISPNGIIVGSLTSDPVSAVNGAIYYNTTLGKFRMYQGGSWEDIASGTVSLTGQALNTAHVIVGNSSNQSASVNTSSVGDIAADATTGLTIKNGVVSTAKLSSSVNTTLTNVGHLITLSGVPAASDDLGTFTGSTIPDSSTIKAALQALETEVELKINTADKGVANGVASLDGNGKVPLSQLPNSILEYKGTWDASTNTPTLTNGNSNPDTAIGDVWRVTVAGTVDFGAGNITFAVGDYVILNSSKIWEKAQTSEVVAGVSSVNSLVGAVVLNSSHLNHSQSDTSDWTVANNSSIAAHLDELADRMVAVEAIDVSNKANTSLNNLASVAINASLLPATTNTINLGSSLKVWKDLYLDGSVFNSTQEVVDLANSRLKSGNTTKLDWSGTDVSLNTRKLINVSDPTAAQDAATKAYVDTADAAKANTSLNNLASVSINTSLIPATNGTLDLGSTSNAWQNLYLNGSIFNSTQEVVDLAASRLKSGNTTKLDWSGTDVSLNTRKLINVSDPTAAQDAATKAYVDTTAATRALDNLASVAINTSLLPDSNNNIDLGSNTIAWRNAYLKEITQQNSSAGAKSVKTLDKVNLPSNTSSFTNFKTISFANSNLWGVVIDYSVNEDTTGNKRVGRFYLSKNGTSITLVDTSTETDSIGNGLDFQVVASGSDANIQFKGTAAHIATIVMEIKEIHGAI